MGLSNQINEGHGTTSSKVSLDKEKKKVMASSSLRHLHTRLAVVYEPELVVCGAVATACECDVL